jgi:glucan phosphoethanolaminetransferase (alkaline phosphatase superfamily)
VTSYTDSEFAGTQYMPYQYEVLFIAIGFFCLVVMKYCQEIEVLLGLLSLIAFGIAAWFAPYICITDVFPVVDNTDGTTTVLYTQYVTPEPILQMFLVLCFLFAVIATIYVTFLRQADQVLDNAELIKMKAREE